LPVQIRRVDLLDQFDMIFSCGIFRSCLKIRIFVRDQGEAEDQSAGILKYVEDLIRGLNADIGRKDFFEMTSSCLADAEVPDG
jgi:hypothetical protein